MPDIIDRPAVPRASLGARLLWFVGLWAASVACVAAVAYGIRFWIR